MSARRICCAGAGLVVMTCAAGCGADGPTMVPIRGEVYFNGERLRNVPQGLVRYVPKTPESGRQASGRIQPDGTFVLTTFKRADGVVPGEYNVIVSAYSSEPLSRQETEASGGVGVVGPKLMIPEKYLDPEKTGITDTVDSSHSGFKRIELSS